MEDSITTETLVGLWNPNLSNEGRAALEKYTPYALTPIWPQSFPRKLECLDCQEIRFQDQQANKIFTTSGSGEIILPKYIGVFITNGKHRVLEVQQ